MTVNTHAETANGGARRRRPARWTHQITVYVPEAFDEAFALLGSSGVLDKSDHLRLALQAYLQHVGMLPNPEPR